MGIDGVETFRGTMQGRTPEGYDSTVIVLRRGEGLNERVWLVFDGAIKTTVVMTDPQTEELIELLGDAQNPPVRRGTRQRRPSRDNNASSGFA